jgi:hypothetical protein
MMISELIFLFVVQLVYAACALMRMEDVVRSQSGVGLAGVVLVGLTVAAGLGLCALLGIPFNASTTQVSNINTRYARKALIYTSKI